MTVSRERVGIRLPDRGRARAHLANARGLGKILGLKTPIKVFALSPMLGPLLAEIWTRDNVGSLLKLLQNGVLWRVSYNTIIPLLWEIIETGKDLERGGFESPPL